MSNDPLMHREYLKGSVKSLGWEDQIDFFIYKCARSCQYSRDLVSADVRTRGANVLELVRMYIACYMPACAHAYLKISPYLLKHFHLVTLYITVHIMSACSSYTS